MRALALGAAALRFAQRWLGDWVSFNFAGLRGAPFRGRLCVAPAPRSAAVCCDLRLAAAKFVVCGAMQLPACLHLLFAFVVCLRDALRLVLRRLRLARRNAQCVRT